MKDDQIINEPVNRDADICAKYSYWQKVNMLISIFMFPIFILLNILFIALVGYLLEDGGSSLFTNFYLFVKREWLFSCCLVIGCSSPILATFKLSKFLRFIVSSLFTLVVCVWLWCLVLSLMDTEKHWMTDAILVFGLIPLIPAFCITIFTIECKIRLWRFSRSEVVVQERKLKRSQNLIARKINSFLSRHQALTFCDSRSFIFYSAGWMSVFIVVFSLLIMLYFYVGGIDHGNRSLADMKDLSIELRDVPDEDNAYLSLISLTNKCTVARSGCGDTYNEDERLFVRDFTNWDPSLLTDEEETKKWYSIQNDTNSLNRARKIISDNEEFFKAFPDAVTKNQFSACSDILKKYEYNPYEGYLPYYIPFIEYAKLFSLRVRLALEDKDIESALADIITMYALGEKIAIKFSPHGTNPIPMEFLVGCKIIEISFEQMQYLIAEDKASDEMLAKFDMIVDKAKTSILNQRDLLVKGWFLYACKAVDWYTSKNLFDAIYELINPGCFLVDRKSRLECLANLSWHRRFRMMLFCWPMYSKFVFHREETLNKLANFTREVIAKKEIDSLEEDSDNILTLADMVTTRNGFGKNIISRGKYELKHILNICVNNALFSITKMKLIIAAAKWRKAHGGKTPPSLEALVPEYLSNVPIDPFDKNGGPLKYDAKLGVVWCRGKRGDYDYYDAVKQLSSAAGVEKVNLRSTIHENSFRIDALPILQPMR